MSENTKIEWAEHTFNPWWGCQRVSEACRNCYAETFAKRVGQKVWGPPTTTPRRLFGDKHWAEPLAWDAKAKAAGVRHRVFCASMADVFEDHPEVESERQRLWDLIAETPNLIWLLLTKRPENIATMVPEDWLRYHDGEPGWPDNVWPGTTVEDQAAADARVWHLCGLPAPVRFLSMEPLLGPTNLRAVADAVDPDEHRFDALNGGWYLPANEDGYPEQPVDGPVAAGLINWVITGGESGGHARPTHPDWIRALRDDCQDSGVAFHFKQHGEWLGYTEDAQPPFWDSVADGSMIDGHHLPDGIGDGGTVNGWRADLGLRDRTAVYHRVGKKAAGRLLDGRTWDEMPASSSVRA